MAYSTAKYRYVHKGTKENMVDSRTRGPPSRHLAVSRSHLDGTRRRRRRERMVFSQGGKKKKKDNWKQACNERRRRRRVEKAIAPTNVRYTRAPQFVKTTVHPPSYVLYTITATIVVHYIVRAFSQKHKRGKRNKEGNLLCVCILLLSLFLSSRRK